jgi:lipopolysaccharide/colanic/teichoic acid biosynthesis glycosyltransferase
MRPGQRIGNPMGSTFMPSVSSAPLRVPFWKRVLDIACILFLLPLLLPLMLAIAAMVKLSSSGPVFFRQERVGFLGRGFMCLKFRTMIVNADTSVHQGYLNQLMTSNAPMTKMDAKGDPRLIRCGALLRSSGLDELPQLINVLRGEMSIVGPRPCLPYEYNNYRPRYKKRLETLPGLTGFWQVNGKNKTTFRQMIAMDVWYAKNKSALVDVWIMWRTFPTLFSQVREMMLRRSQNGVIWFPTARRAAAILDAFLQNEAKKPRRSDRPSLRDTKDLGRKSERKPLWQNQFE